MRKKSQNPKASRKTVFSKIVPTTYEMTLMPVYNFKTRDEEGSLKDYYLRLDTKALCLFRDKTGRDLSNPAQWDGMNVEEIITLVWAAMNKFQPEMTLEEVYDMVPASALKPLYMILLELFKPGIVDLMVLAADAKAKQEAQGELVPNPPEAAVNQSSASLPV